MQTQRICFLSSKIFEKTFENSKPKNCYQFDPSVNYLANNHHMYHYFIFHFIPLCRILCLVITQTFTFSHLLFVWKCCPVPWWAFYLRYRNNDMSPKTPGDGGRGLGWQHGVNDFLNPILVNQTLNIFFEFFVKQMVYWIFAQKKVVAPVYTGAKKYVKLVQNLLWRKVPIFPLGGDQES